MTRAELLGQFIWQLRRAFRELTVAAEKELEALGIQVGDRALLEFLSRETAPVSLSDLAKKHSVSRQHIHQALRRLPRADWVEQIPDPSDRRAVLLRLSKKGRAFWDRVRQVDRTFLTRLGERLPEERLTAANDLLTQFRAELRMRKETADEQN